MTKQLRTRTCMYFGAIHQKLKGCTGHARQANEQDGPSLAGLWAFQVGGEGAVIWVRTSDLQFLRGPRTAQRA